MTYIFFWGTTGTYGFLSNFFKCTFHVNGVDFNCSEQYFMKMKQELFDPFNEHLAKCILSETNPVQIKKYGRMVKNFNGQHWDTTKYNIMCNALEHKFIQNPILKQRLIDIGNAILVEASPHDIVWGIGLSQQVARITPECAWRGQNLLGKALMHIRHNLMFG